MAWYSCRPCLLSACNIEFGWQVYSAASSSLYCKSTSISAMYSLIACKGSTIFKNTPATENNYRHKVRIFCNPFFAPLWTIIFCEISISRKRKYVIFVLKIDRNGKYLCVCVIRIRICINPLYFGKLDPDPICISEKSWPGSPHMKVKNRSRIPFKVRRICNTVCVHSCTACETADHRSNMKVWSPKFIWSPCHVMCTAVLIAWDPASRNSPPTPALARIRGRYWSATIDDISL
jgi:hypothetical protein